MNNLLISGFSILIGMASAGMVWYFWGMSDNIQVLRKNRALKLQAAMPPETDEAGEGESAEN